MSLAENGKTLFLKESTDGLNHSELLTVFIQDLFKENNFEIKDIDAVAVSMGPGSYTGLRIGVSVAKGLCYALDKPLIGIGSIDAMGNHLAKYHSEFTDENPDSILLCPMIDARRMEVYTSVYNANGEQLQPVSAEIINENSFSDYLKDKKVLFLGNGAEKCKSKLTHPNALFNGPSKTSARFMQSLAEIRFNKKEFEDLAYFEPYYLKDFVATIPKNKVLK